MAVFLQALFSGLPASESPVAFLKRVDLKRERNLQGHCDSDAF